MKLCACQKVWRGHTTCKGCGAAWNEMARMHRGKYFSENLIVKVNEQGHINTIKIDGNRIHASINYGGIL